jgi:aryl-alcohol dehydrogenase-like predicted oxidoreductase
MLTRRRYLQLATAFCAALGSGPARVLGQDSDAIIKRAIPATGEELPIVGLGSSASFRRLADSGDSSAIRAIFAALLDGGGSVFDTAPGYGSSEAMAGQVIGAMNARERVFWATKLNVAGFGGGRADANEAWAQVEASLDYYGAEPVDLIQVHNLADMDTQFPILTELKAAGRARYIGITATFKPQYEAFEKYMRTEPLDFIGVDYAVDNTSAEETIFPIAQDRGIAVLVYLPFGRTRLWGRVAGREVPDWAVDFGATTWAQFFIKFAASHPAVTVVTPATSRPQHMLDNLGAAFGRMPSAEERQRMVDYVAALPEA